jgi:hypothetical protein
MAKNLAGVLAVSIAALLFAGCGGGESKWTDSKCKEIGEKLGFGSEPWEGSGVKTKAIGFKRVASESVEDFDKRQKWEDDHPGIFEEWAENCD